MFFIIYFCNSTESGLNKISGNAMALIQVSQISFESEVCGVKWRHFYEKIINR